MYYHVYNIFYSLLPSKETKQFPRFALLKQIVFYVRYLFLAWNGHAFGGNPFTRDH